MGIVAKQSIWNTILLYAGVLIGYVNVVLLFPMVIGDEAYGLTRILLSIVFIAQQFAMIGTPSVLLRYFPRFEGVGKKGLVYYTLAMTALGTGLIVLLMILFKDPIIAFKVEESDLLNQYYLLSIPITLCMVAYLYFTAICRAYLETTLPIFTYEFLFKIITMLLLLGTWYFEWSLNTFLWLWMLSYTFNVITLFIHLLIKKRLDLTRFEQKDTPFIKESLDFGFFTMLGGASNSIISNIDILMIGLLLSTDSLELAGIYAIMVYIGNTVLMPSRGLTTITSPLISQYIERKEHDKLQDIYERTSLNQTVVSGFLLLAMYINLPRMLELLKIDPELGTPVFILIGLARMVQTGAGVNGLIINFSSHYRWTTYFIALLAIVAVLTNYYMIPLYGIKGAAFATFISLAGFEFLKWLFVRINMDLQPFTIQHVKAIGVAFLLLIINYFIPDVGGWFWWDVLIRSMVFSILAFIALMKVDIAPDLKDMVLVNLKKFGLYGK